MYQQAPPSPEHGTAPQWPSAPSREDDRDDLNLHDLWQTLVRQRWIVAGVAAAVVLLTAVMTWRQRPTYESEATLRIEEQDRGQSLLGDLGSAGGFGPEKIQTEMVVLRSRQIAEAVVDSLGLHVELLAPERPRTEVLRVFSAPRDAVPATYLLTLRGGDYTVAVEQAGGRVSAPPAVGIGAPVTLGGVSLALQPGLGADPPQEIRIRVAPHRAAAAGLLQTLRVARLDPQAEVVSIGYRSTDPVLAAAVPNAAAASFIRYKDQSNKVVESSTVRFLREQVAAYETQLDEAEGRLRAFREREQVVSLPDQATEQVRRLAELQARREELSAERDALAQLLARVSQGQRRTGGNSPYRELAAFPTFLGNPAVQNLLQSLTELENDRAELLVQRTTENVDVRGITQRISEIELQLFQTANSYLNSLDSQIASTNTSLAEFGQQLRTIPAREVEFARLSRQGELLEDIYTLLQTRLKEAEIKQAVDPGNVRVVDPALVPEQPVSPRPVRNLAFAAVLGLVLGVGAAFGRQALDTKVHSKEDVQGATHGLPILAIIPRIRARDAAAGNGTPGRRERQASRLGGFGAPELVEERLVTKRDPRSPVAEAYRALRTNLTFASIEHAPRVAVVTSSSPSEGKSTSAANLAITLAQQGARALLVDADLRRGYLHRVLGARPDPGLTHVLLGQASLDAAIQTIPLDHADQPLHFLATGVLPPNPAELLGSERMRHLLDDLRERFDMVILDAPPLNLVTDAAILGTVADTTLLVARSGATDRRALEHATSQLRHLRVGIGGVILNDFDASGGAGYYGGYGYYQASADAQRNGKH